MNVQTLNDIINPKNIKRSDIERVVLEKADFHTDPMSGEKYFDLVYRCCAKNGLEWLVEFPRVINVLPIDAFPGEAQLLPGETATRFLRGRICSSRVAALKRYSRIHRYLKFRMKL